MGFKDLMKAKSFQEYVDAKKDPSKMEEIKNRGAMDVLKNSAKSIEETNEAANAIKSAKKIAKNTIVCPNCGSLNVQFMQNNKKGFSVGKAAGGALLTGGVGTLAGFAGKKGKNQWFCQDCNQIFERKN